MVNPDVKKFKLIETLIDAYVLKFAEFGRRILQQDRTSEDRNVSSLSRFIEELPFIEFDQFPESFQSYFGYSLEDDDAMAGAGKYVSKFIKDLRRSFDDIYGDSEWAKESTFCLPNGKRSTNPNIRGHESYLSRLIQHWNRYL
jgi:hypothetical protein